MSCCRLESERLLLRPPEPRDVPAIVTWIGDWDVAKNLSKCPHPYTEEHAQEFLLRAAEGRAKGTDFGFAITRKSDGCYLGQIGLHLKDGTFEVGYWLGKPFWFQGFASEAARRVVAFAFRDLRAETVWAGWFHDNPRSGHVLEKLGCRPNGQEPRACLARGHEVLCNLVVLSRADFFGRKMAA
jgi:ribosomal-protein-alanine N-acetyltransferase